MVSDRLYTKRLTKWSLNYSPSSDPNFSCAAIGSAASFTSVVVRSLRVLSRPHLFRVAFFTALGICISYGMLLLSNRDEKYTAETNMSLSNGYGHGGRARSASHAGSWYSGNRSQLDGQLTRWLDAAGDRVGVARAIISP